MFYILMSIISFDLIFFNRLSANEMFELFSFETIYGNEV
jgi:hypothetical protein